MKALKLKGNFSEKRLREIASCLIGAAQKIERDGWCKESLRQPGQEKWVPGVGFRTPSRVCMMGAIQDTMRDKPSSVRFLAYDIVHQCLDGVPMQDFNDSQTNPKPVIKKLLQAAVLVQEKADSVAARQSEPCTTLDGERHG